jgi:hypothetical protein
MAAESISIGYYYRAGCCGRREERRLRRTTPIVHFSVLRDAATAVGATIGKLAKRNLGHLSQWASLVSERDDFNANG